MEVFEILSSLILNSVEEKRDKKGEANYTVLSCESETDRNRGTLEMKQLGINDEDRIVLLLGCPFKVIKFVILYL